MFNGSSAWESASIVWNNEQVTCFILQAHTGMAISHSQDRKNSGEVLNAGELAGGVEISKEEIPSSKHSMYGYIPTNSRL